MISVLHNPPRIATSSERPAPRSWGADSSRMDVCEQNLEEVDFATVSPARSDPDSGTSGPSRVMSMMPMNDGIDAAAKRCKRHAAKGGVTRWLP